MSRLKIGQEVLIHGYIDEIRKDTVIIRNEGGYFGTIQEEISVKPQEPSDISNDGTLTVNVEDGRKISRVLVCGANHWGGLYYPDEQVPKTGHWIPVSERLPEENEYIGDVCKYYLIQDEYGDMHVAHLSNVGWIPMDSLKAICNEVIAWMPMPKPYEASRKEYKKCRLYGESASEATDWALKYDACGMFNKDCPHDKPLVNLVSPEKRKEVQIDGQMRLEL